MSELNKTVKRTIRDFMFGGDHGDYEIALKPSKSGGILTFRKLRTSKVIGVPLDACYYSAARIAADALRREHGNLAGEIRKGRRANRKFVEKIRRKYHK